MASIEELKELIDLRDLAERLSLTRPTGKGNYRSPKHTDKNPSLSIFANGKAWKDHSTGAGGSCVDLVKYVIGCDTASASLGIGGGMLIKGGSRISAETRSAESVDSRVVDIHNRIAHSYEESQSNSLDRVEANQALAATTGTYIDEIYKRAKTEKYGPKNITKNLMMGGEQFSQNRQSGEITEGMDD